MSLTFAGMARRRVRKLQVNSFGVIVLLPHKKPYENEPSIYSERAEFYNRLNGIFTK